MFDMVVVSLVTLTDTIFPSCCTIRRLDCALVRLQGMNIIWALHLKMCVAQNSLDPLRFTAFYLLSNSVIVRVPRLSPLAADPQFLQLSPNGHPQKGSAHCKSKQDFHPASRLCDFACILHQEVRAVNSRNII